MPDPVYENSATTDDLLVANAYMQWVATDFENRVNRLPNRSVVVYLEAESAVLKGQRVELGEKLHSYLNPANPAAGEWTAGALTNGGVSVPDLENLGRHIHPDVLDEEQSEKWTTAKDLDYAACINQLYDEGYVTEKYIPPAYSKGENKKREVPYPDWVPTARTRLYVNLSKRLNPMGPAQARGFAMSPHLTSPFHPHDAG